MTEPLAQLIELDEKLFALLQMPLTEFDDEALDQGLTQRAVLLQQVATLGEANEQQIKALIVRSQQLTTLAEAVKKQLGEQLKTIQKGRRSQQAYQSVKYQE